MSIYITLQILSSFFSLLIVILLSVIIFKFFKKKFIILFFKYWIDIAFVYFTSNMILITNPIQNFQNILIANFIIYILLFYYLTNNSLGNIILSKVKKTPLYIEDNIISDNIIDNEKTDKYITKNIKKEKSEQINNENTKIKKEDQKQIIINESTTEEKAVIKTPQTIICKCGKENSIKDKFCSNCWTKVISPEIENNPPKTIKHRRKTEKGPIIASIIIIILVILWATPFGIIIIVWWWYLIIKIIKTIWSFLFHRKRKEETVIIRSNIQPKQTKTVKVDAIQKIKTKKNQKIDYLKANNIYYKLMSINKKWLWVYKIYSIFLGIILVVWSWELLMSWINYAKIGTNFLDYNSSSIISDGDYDGSFDSGIFDTNSDGIFDTYKFDINQDEKVDIKYFIENWWDDITINKENFVVLDYKQERIFIILITIIFLFWIMWKNGKIKLDNKKAKLAISIIIIYIFHINTFNLSILLKSTSYAMSLWEVEESLKTEPIWWKQSNREDNEARREIDEYNKGLGDLIPLNDNWMSESDWESALDDYYDEEYYENNNERVPDLCKDPQTKDSAQCWSYNWENNNGESPNYGNKNNNDIYNNKEEEYKQKLKVQKQEKIIENSINDWATNIKAGIDATSVILNTIWVNTKWVIEEIKNIKKLHDIGNIKVELVDDYLKQLNSKYIYNSKTATRLRSDKIKQLVGKIQKYEKMAGKWMPIKNYVKELKTDLSKVDEALLKNRKFVDANTNKSILAKSIKKSQKIQKWLKVLDVGGKVFGAYLDYQEFDKEFKWDSKKTIMATTATSTVWNMLGSNPVDLVMNWVSGSLQLLGYTNAAKTAGNFTAWAIFKDTVKNSLDDDEASIWWAVDIMVDELNNAEWFTETAGAAVNLWVTATYAAGVYGTRKGFQLIGSGISAVGNGAKKIWSYIR